MLPSKILTKHAQRARIRNHISLRARYISAKANKEHYRVFSENPLPQSYWTYPENRRKYLEFLAQVKCEQAGESYSPSSGCNVLYSATTKDFSLTGGMTLLVHRYNSSVARLVSSEFPEFAWNIWMFALTPRGWWEDVRRKYLEGDCIAQTVVRLFIEQSAEQIGVQLQDSRGLKKLEYHLYKVQPYRIGQLGPLSHILETLGIKSASTSISKLHSDTFINIKGSTSPEYWMSPQNRRIFLDSWLMNMRSIEDFYTIHFSTISALAGLNFFRPYGQLHPAIVIMTEFPEHAWRPWKFRMSPRKFWHELGVALASGSPEAQVCLRLFLEDLEEKYNFQSVTDWEAVVSGVVPLTKTDKTRINLLGPLPQVLSIAYPHVTWNFTTSGTKKLVPFSDNFISSNHWNSHEFVRSYLLFLRDQLGGNMEDLYKLTTDQILQTGGFSLLQKFNNSVFAILKHAFPEHEWYPWKFSRSPTGSWAELSTKFAGGDEEAVRTIRIFIQDLAKELNVKKLSHWYKVIEQKRLKHRFSEQLKHFQGGLLGILRQLYPDHNWRIKRPEAVPRSVIVQRRLTQLTDELLEVRREVKPNLEFKCHSKS